MKGKSFSINSEVKFILILHFSSFFILVFSVMSFCQVTSMLQSNMLSKENVEKSLVAVPMKLRIKVPLFDNAVLV